jgi:hypothetical protein
MAALEIARNIVEEIQNAIQLPGNSIQQNKALNASMDTLPMIIAKIGKYLLSIPILPNTCIAPSGRGRYSYVTLTSSYVP